MEIVKELGNGRFVARNRKGEEIILTPIDEEEIKRSHMERIKQAAKKIDKNEIIELKNKVKSYIDDVIDIDDWHAISVDLTNEVSDLYKKIGKPNIFYHSIKNIDPNHYGRAEKFRSECKHLYSICDEILNEL